MRETYPWYTSGILNYEKVKEWYVLLNLLYFYQTERSGFSRVEKDFKIKPVEKHDHM